MARSAEKLLKESGVGFLTHRWRAFASFDELLARQGTHQVVRTVAVEAPDRIVLVALRAEDELDYGKLARTLGVDRDPITVAAAGRLADLLDADPGFETVLTDADIDRLVDERVLRLSKALVSSGSNDRLYELAPTDLVTVSGATVADLACETAS
jgi:prolyl-tRNA editing enzyme YbaK/EbsC (Cys-tRNA(Pro) deacylase)